jgi:hypothetical protein
MASKFINLTDTLEQWRVKANAVYGTVGDLTTLSKNASVTYNNLVGVNADDFAGTPAQFNVTRTAGSYSVAIANGGTTYAVNDTITIPGTELGGESPANDAVITVTSVDPGFAIDGATVTGTAVADIISEVNSLREEQGDINLALATNSETVRDAVNEFESVLRGAGEQNYSFNTDASNVVDAINELETAVRGTLTDYDLDTDASDLVSAINEFQTEIGRIEDFNAQGTSSDSRVTYVDLGSTIVSAINALKAKTELNADELGGIMTTDYDGPEANHMDALNALYNASSLGTLDNTYVRRSGTLDMTGLFQIHSDGITSNGNNLLLKTGASDITAITINASNQNVGIGGAPGTHKVKVTGSVNATTGLYWDGDSTDTRYIRADVGAAQNLDIDTTVRASINLAPNTGETVTIGGSVVTNDTFNFLEWVQDQVGGMVTGNTETGGISAVYDDSTGKITMAIANNSHTHVSTNITDWTEAVQDTVGAMVTGNTENGISVTYSDTAGKLNFDVNDPVITISGEASGSATMTNLGNTNISVTLQHEAIQDAVGEMLSGNTETGISVTYDDANNEIDFALTADPRIVLAGDLTGNVTLTNLNTQDFTLTATVLDDSHNHVIGNIDNFTEEVQDIVGTMFAPTNTEAGISITYDDSTGKMNSDVNDFTITLSGDVTGTATVTNLGSVTMTTTVGNNSHTHDDRYYTESESDSRFFNVSGDTVTGDAYFNADVYVGSNGGGNSHIHFYDDNNDTWRTLKFDQSNWIFEDNGGTDRVMLHSGNFAGYTPTNATNATNSTYSDYTYVTRDDSTNTTYYPVFAAIGSSQQRMRNDGGLSYNPSTNTLSTGIFSGTATSARYADLAEKYLPDAEYRVGTVMKVGGEKEITASTVGSRAIGVISENPAYMMNSELEGGVYVALKGRVPVRCMGPISKGDELIPTSDGLAFRGDGAKVFAVALEDKSGPEEGLVECVIL